MKNKNSIQMIFGINCRYASVLWIVFNKKKKNYSVKTMNNIIIMVTVIKTNPLPMTLSPWNLAIFWFDFIWSESGIVNLGGIAHLQGKRAKWKERRRLMAINVVESPLLLALSFKIGTNRFGLFVINNFKK